MNIAQAGAMGHEHNYINRPIEFAFFSILSALNPFFKVLILHLRTLQ